MIAITKCWNFVGAALRAMETSTPARFPTGFKHNRTWLWFRTIRANVLLSIQLNKGD